MVERAGSSIGNYYHYFGDKEGLLIALVERTAERIAERIDIARAAATGSAQRLTTMVTTGIAAALEERPLAALLFAGSFGDRAREIIADRFIGRTAEVLDSLRDTGLASLNPDVSEEPSLTNNAEISTELLATLWQGSILMLIERLLAGRLEVDPTEAGRICAAWNLRALGWNLPVRRPRRRDDQGDGPPAQ